MPTRMTHPLHGATHAYDTGEITRLEGYGWSVEKPAAIDFAKEIKENYEEYKVEFKPVVLVAPERKKPGPKPKAK
jgi:hypothetical protein